jgi:hypothetical protein
MNVRVVLPIAIAGLLVGSMGWAQYSRSGYARLMERMAQPDSSDGQFHYCRAMYRANMGGDGGNWLTDYPLADIDLSIRLAELTRTRVGFNGNGEPEHLIVRLTDDALFQCPFIMMQEVGSLFFSEEDVTQLRTYLLKGGFLWVDDFWGSYAWSVWERQIQKVLPPSEFTIVDLPPDHPIFHTMFDLQGVPQIPGISYWYGSRGGTSERGYDSAEVHARAIADDDGRIMVFMTHNTDVSDSWEREGEDPQYFFGFSIPGYQTAINVLLYAMTH